MLTVFLRLMGLHLMTMLIQHPRHPSSLIAPQQLAERLAFVNFLRKNRPNNNGKWVTNLIIVRTSTDHKVIRYSIMVLNQMHRLKIVRDLNVSWPCLEAAGPNQTCKMYTTFFVICYSNF